MERELLAAGLHARLAQDGIVLPLVSIVQHLRTPPNSPLHEGERGDVELFTHGVHAASTPDSTLDGERLRTLHRIIAGEGQPEARAGEWRSLPTGAPPWEGVPPEVIGLFTEELCEWLASPVLSPSPSTGTNAHALLRLLLAELYFAWIRPFGSAHFRMAAVAGITLLRSAGMGPTAAHLLAIGLQRHGREFHRQVRQASEGPADPLPFLEFSLQALGDVVREWHAHLRDLQTKGQWRAQLLELFREGGDEPTRRQRQVLLDLAGTAAPVPLGRLDSLSPSLAKLYAGVSEKTMRRDVDALITAGLVKRVAEGLHVDLSNLLAFKA